MVQIRKWTTGAEGSAAYLSFVHFDNDDRADGALGWATNIAFLDDNVSGRHA